MAKDDKNPDLETPEEKIIEEPETADEAIDEFIKDIIEEDPSAETKTEVKTEDSDDSLVEDKGAETSSTEEVVEADSLIEDKEAGVSTSVETDQVTVTEEAEDSGNSLVEDKGAEVSTTEEVVEVDSLIEGEKDNMVSTSAESGRVTVVEGPPAESNEVSDAGEENDRQDPPTAVPKKKSKAPLIIFLCLLLCALGGAITWLILRSTPEAQVSDAISNLLTAKQVSTTGSFNVKFDESANPDIRSIKLDIGATSAHIPATTSATLSVTTQSNSTFKIDLGETIARDGTIYLKISGLKKAINNAKVPEEVEAYLDYFSDVIDETDGQWWMIAVPDLLDQISSSLDADLDTTSYANAYQCILDQVAENDGSELANLYRKYPFINVANYTGTTLQPVDNGTIFSISVNQVQLTNFQNELKNTEYQKSLKRCTDQITSANTEADSTSDQVDDTLNTLADLPPAYVEVSGFDHHLSRFYYDYEVDDFGSFNLDLRFSYPNTVSVDTPTDARTITELIDDIIDDMQYMLYDIYYSPYQYEDCITNGNSTNCVVLN